MDKFPKYCSLLLALVLGTVLGFKELADVDIGWHLAGGLWMLDHRQLPVLDPFGSEARFWWCYSWLPEILFAVVYEGGGFRGLQILQWLSVLLVCFLLWKLTWSVQIAQKFANPLREFLLRSLALLLLIVFVSPIWHLRPQLYSFALFVTLILLAETGRLSLRYLIPLIVLWANVHIYWILAPLLVLVYDGAAAVRVRSAKVFTALTFKLVLCVVAALLTPYPLQQFAGLWSYLAAHREAYALISEFQPLSSSTGYLGWLWCGALALVCLKFRRLNFGASAPLFILFVIFSGAALYRIKFVPLFGLVAILLLLKNGQIFGSTSGAKTNDGFQSSASMYRLATVLVGVFIVLTVMLIETPVPLGLRQRELQQLSKIAQSEVKQMAPARVLNHFDDGGWLALFFYLENRTSKPEAILKTSIDGRTLVMGERRLREFRRLQALSTDHCEVLSKWDATVAILPLEMRLTQSLLDTNTCDLKWREHEQLEKFVLLMRER